MKRIGIWIRVSTEVQKRGDSPEHHLERAKQYADLKEWEVVEEYQNGIINQCQYGYALWQFTGRKSFQPMLDNGFEMIEENGKTKMKSTCE